MRLISALLGGAFGALVMAGPAQALECGEGDRFECLSEHVEATLERLSLEPNETQQMSFDALPALQIYQNDGAESAVKQWEADGLPVYDLILALLLADREQEARRAALAAKKSFVADADGKQIKGKQGFRQMLEDLKSFYHGDENMAFSRACVSDEAFKAEIGGNADLREGACRVPYDAQAVQRAFGMMQLTKGASRDAAVEAVMQYAYRVPSCDVAAAIVDIAQSSQGLGSDDETATWKVLDMATICAAEFLQEQNL